MTAPPSLRWLSRPDAVPEELRRALTACWRDVANGGGAVGFAELLPVDDDDVRPAVEAFVAALGPARCRLLVAERGGELVGWLLVTGNANPVLAHWAIVTRVQTAPGSRGTGVARALMTELHRAARDDLGLERLRIEVRGAAGLEALYERFGWTVVGTWPSALQIAPGDRRDEVLMDLDLRAGVGATDLRERLRAALPAAMKRRDAVLVAVLRTTLAALANAEAVPTGEEDGPGLAIEASPVGVGAREVARRELSDEEVARLVRAEVTDRRDAAGTLERAGQRERADRLRQEADALAAVAGLPPG